MKQKTIQRQSSESKISLRDYDDYKKCPHCGQGLIPFKLGVCFCGQQVGSILYVKNTQSFAKINYSYLGNTVSEKYDTAVDETFAGIEEWNY